MSNPLEFISEERIQQMYERAELQARYTTEYMETLQRELARRAAGAIGEQRDEA